jgi:hypothetical protein
MVTRDQFEEVGREIEIPIVFVPPRKHLLEFRTFWFGNSAVTQGDVVIEKVVPKLPTLDTKRR